MSGGVYIPCTAGVFITAPERPNEPVYEDECLPDGDHDYENDRGDLECRSCGRTTTESTNEWWPNRKCPQLSAARRNYRLRQEYERQLAGHAIQLAYFNSVIVPMGVESDE